MNIKDYISTLKNPLRPRTVSFLVQNNQVMLGLKKKGFGKGYWLGIGGKVEDGEAIKVAAIREVKEETGIKVVNLSKIAVLNFYFPHVADKSWNQQVHAFIVKKWEGEPIESEEIKPEWFDKNKVPLDKMWDDAKYWLPKILQRQEIKGDFLFDENLKVIDYILS